VHCRVLLYAVNLRHGTYGQHIFALDIATSKISNRKTIQTESSVYFVLRDNSKNDYCIRYKHILHNFAFYFALKILSTLCISQNTLIHTLKNKIPRQKNNFNFNLLPSPCQHQCWWFIQSGSLMLFHCVSINFES
jgi:hypothetical protein